MSESGCFFRTDQIYLLRVGPRTLYLAINLSSLVVLRFVLTSPIVIVCPLRGSVWLPWGPVQFVGLKIYAGMFILKTGVFYAPLAAFKSFVHTPRWCGACMVVIVCAFNDPGGVCLFNAPPVAFNLFGAHPPVVWHVHCTVMVCAFNAPRWR